jgi:hypothetical protein
MCRRRRQGDYLTYHLRGELVKRYRIAVSSDAYSNFGWIDSHLHQPDVLQVTKLLHQEAIPTLADMLMKEHRFLSHSDLVVRFHAMGVNLRWLGKVRSLVRAEFQHVRQVLLTEVMARTIRKIMWQHARPQACNANIMLHNAIVATFNSVFDLRDLPRRTTYWRCTLGVEALERFPFCLEPHEEPLALFQDNVEHLAQLLQLVCNYTLVQLTDESLQRLHQSSFRAALNLSDMVQVGIRTRTAFIISRIGMRYTGTH